MFLTSTSDILRLVTGADSAISCQAAWVDKAAGVYNPGRTNTYIDTTTTTTIVASPASSTVRNIKSLFLRNMHATDECAITLQHYDGTTSIDIAHVTLYPGESFTMAEDGELRHLTPAGGEYHFSLPRGGNLGIAGTVAETYPRELFREASTTNVNSGGLMLMPVLLRAGDLVSNISFCTSSTGATSPTNQFFALYSRRYNLLAQSANDTTTAWGANTLKTLAMTTPYRVPVTDIYYVALLITASVKPNFKSVNLTAFAFAAAGLSPALRGQSSTGLTTELPDSCAYLAGTQAAGVIWAAIT